MELITRPGEGNEEEDTLIAIYEKASVEVNKALAEDLQDNYAGWLFSIGTVTEDESMTCSVVICPLRKSLPKTRITHTMFFIIPPTSLWSSNPIIYGR